MLKTNATIAIIAPAGAPDAADLDRGIAFLRQLGFHVREGLHLRDRHRYQAGTIAARSADLVWALTDPSVDAVWLARGGYGCIQSLPNLPMDMPKDRVVVGGSDATALLVALYARGHTNLIHGPMIHSLAVRIDDESRASICNLLMEGTCASIKIEQLCGPATNVDGHLLGGNLTVLASLAGTEWAMSSEQGIVLLEDVGEAIYRLDRSVMQLRLSGALGQAKAIVLGQFIRCPPPKDASFTIDEVLLDLLEPLGVPVVSTAEIGHGERNLSWKYGAPVTIRGGEIHFE
ncbi:MAG TPA: LD-carboxypeptidase [Steroidobacteraceae bacterium]|nr:LD-carboxypeptidase [Steroidobacteraceae bacterium]